MPSGCAPIPTSFISITTSRLEPVPAKACPGHDPGWTSARRLIIRTYDGLSNLKPVALHNSPAHARDVCTENPIRRCFNGSVKAENHDPDGLLYRSLI